MSHSLVADFRILVVEESVGPVAFGVQARLRLLCTSCIFSSICAKKIYSVKYSVPALL
jgi:hypothetical protein